MGDRSAHDQRGPGGQGPSRGQDFGGPGDGCRGWRSGGVWACAEVEEIGRNKMYLFFCVLFSFPLFGGRGGKEYGMPHYDGASSFEAGKGYS